MDLITVIVPVFNGEKTIEKCINSILKQTFSNIQLIIIDDGSTDKTWEICKSFAKSDKRVHIYFQENRGVSAARNYGIQKATGNYIQFVDSDDYIDDHMLETLWKKLKAENAGMAVCNYMEENGADSHPGYIKAKPVMNQIEFMRALVKPDSIKGYMCNKLFDLNVIHNNHLRVREDVYVCEDMLFCFEYAEYINKVVYMQEPFYHYVYVSTSSTHKKYNEKKFSVLKSFELIKSITKVKGDKQLDKAVEAHYLVFIIQLFVMLRRGGYTLHSDKMKIVLSNMRHRKLCLFFTNWHLRYKIVCVPLKLLSFICGGRK